MHKKYGLVLATWSMVFGLPVGIPLAKANLCKLPNGQVINVNRPCMHERFEMPVAPPAPSSSSTVPQGQMPRAPMPGWQGQTSAGYSYQGGPAGGAMPRIPTIPAGGGGWGGGVIIPSSLCVVNVGTCQSSGEPVNSQCICIDDQGNTYAGIAQ